MMHDRFLRLVVTNPKQRGAFDHAENVCPVGNAARKSVIYSDARTEFARAASDFESPEELYLKNRLGEGQTQRT
jgi:hypothetical protein